MESAPIKRNPNLVPLSKEHHLTLLFSWKLKTGLSKNIEPKRIVHYISWFEKEHLLPHFKSEELLLFKDPNDSMVERALKEHQEISALIGKIKKEGEDLEEEILQLAELVKAHTRYEERELFPYLEMTLSDKELEHLGKELHQEPHSADENYIDPFWETPTTK